MRYIGFLRAINVGGHVVKMDRMRVLFTALDLTNVETFIASGNVAFDTKLRSAAALETRIEAQLRDALGYEVATFLRTPDELAAVAQLRPFGTANIGGVAGGPTLSVGFLKAVPDDEQVRQLMEHRGDIDDFHVEGREVYWLCQTRTSDSKFSGAALEKLLRAPATFRNITTVRKIAGAMHGAGG